MERPHFVVTTAVAPSAVAYLREHAEVTDVSALPREAWDDALARADGALVGSGTPVDAAFVAAAPRLRIVATYSVGYDNVHTRVGDGYNGWPEAAPFDAVIVTCAPEKVPAPLVEQLKEGGRMVIPLGDRYMQVVYLKVKRDGKLVDVEDLRPTLFVPMTGRAQRETAVESKKEQP